MTQQHTVILGIGNTLLSDEGVGVHMLDYLTQHYPQVARHQLIDGGTLSFTLAVYVEQARQLVVIDAAELGQPPGTVQLFEGADMDRFVGRTRRSVHEVSLGDLLAIAHLTGHLPERRALIGIQPMTIDWGRQLSAPVQAARAPAALAVEQLLERWAAGESGSAEAAEPPLSGAFEAGSAG